MQKEMKEEICSWKEIKDNDTDNIHQTFVTYLPITSFYSSLLLNKHESVS